MTINLATNHLALEPILIARLATVTGLSETGGAFEYEAMRRTGKPAPAAYVLYGGTATVSTPNGGHQVPRIIDQVWSIALVCKPAPAVDGSSLHAAGALLAATMAAFEGYKPAGLIDPLEDVSTDDAPVIYANGLVLFILNYRARSRLG